MTTRKYEASGVEAEFEPGSRNRVLRNLLGIVREADMDEAESESLDRVYEESITQFGPTHRFSSRDIRDLHAAWLGPIYSWAGEYRTLNIGKGGSCSLMPLAFPSSWKNSRVSYFGFIHLAR